MPYDRQAEIRPPLPYTAAKTASDFGGSMKILMVTAEAVPFAKTGGLADMVSALAASLAKLGHDVKIVMPRYYKIDRKKLKTLPGPLALSLIHI